MLLESRDLDRPSPLGDRVRADHRVDEAVHVERLAGHARLSAAADARVHAFARDLVTHLRRQRRKVGNIDALMQEYDLSSEEGVTLMCLAEALLRIPDVRTQDEFIEEK